ARWLELEGHIEESNKRARVKDFADIEKSILKDYPDLSRAEHRKQILFCIQEVGRRVAVGVISASPEKRRMYEQAFKEFDEEWQKRVADPEFAPPARAFKLSDHAVQWAHEIVEGVSEFFICRHRDCGLVARNTDWMIKDAEHYGCVGCLRQYQPWKQGGNLVKANKILVVDLEDSEAGDAQQAVDVGANLAESAGGQRFLLHPFEWPDTTVTNLINKMKEVTASLDAVLDDVPEKEQWKHVCHELQAKAAPGLMTHKTLPHQKIKEIWEKNAQMNSPWRFDHIADSEYYAFSLQDHAVQNLDNPLSQHEVLSIFARSKWLLHQFPSRL
ncbi:unnamed protein product, partial [Prorocentrum cordatum]